MSSEIHEVLEKMRLSYIANLPQQLDTIELLVLKLKKDEDYEYSSENLSRAVHSLRGTAGTYGIPIISIICQPFEDYLTDVHKHGCKAGEQQIDTCICFIDLLRRARDQVAAGSESFPEIEASLAEL